VLPQAERCEEQQRERELSAADGPICGPPSGSNAHEHPGDKRTARRAAPPAGVQPVHVPPAVVTGDKAIQPRVHRACADAEGYAQQIQGETPGRKAHADKAHARQGTACEHDDARAITPYDPTAHEAGKAGHERAEDDDRTREADRQAKLRVHRGPRDPEGAVRQAKADVAEVDDEDQQ